MTLAIALFALAGGLPADRAQGPAIVLVGQSEKSAVLGGASFDVALRLTIPEPWHVYWVNSGDSGMPTKVEWTLPDGWTAGPLRFPTPTRYDLDGIVTYGFSRELTVLSRISVPKAAKAERKSICAPR
jgi:thiol:disulfide interchange protein DsbD